MEEAKQLIQRKLLNQRKIIRGLLDISNANRYLWPMVEKKIRELEATILEIPVVDPEADSLVGQWQEVVVNLFEEYSVAVATFGETIVPQGASQPFGTASASIATLSLLENGPPEGAFNYEPTVYEASPAGSTYGDAPIDEEDICRRMKGLGWACVVPSTPNGHLNGDEKKKTVVKHENGSAEHGVMVNGSGGSDGRPHLKNNQTNVQHEAGDRRAILVHHFEEQEKIYESVARQFAIVARVTSPHDTDGLTELLLVVAAAAKASIPYWNNEPFQLELFKLAVGKMPGEMVDGFGVFLENSEPPRMRKLAELKIYLGDQIAQEYRRRQKDASAANGQVKSPKAGGLMVCYYCKEPGHFQMACPKLNNRVCFKCEGKGHKASNCTNPNTK